MTTIWLPEPLMYILDEIVKAKNDKYASRSDLIRIAIVHYLICQEGIDPEALMGKKPIEIKKAVFTE